MGKTKIEREKVYEVAKTIATAVYSKNCVEEGCVKCPNNGDCTPMEMAYQVVGAGYELANNENSTIITHEPAQVENLAKTIASSRGYGCDDKDSCAKCPCRVVECIPLTISELLVKAGCEKRGEV
jgi:hypothetical protein